MHKMGEKNILLTISVSQTGSEMTSAGATIQAWNITLYYFKHKIAILFGSKGLCLFQNIRREHWALQITT